MISGTLEYPQMHSYEQAREPVLCVHVTHLVISKIQQNDLEATKYLDVWN